MAPKFPPLDGSIPVLPGLLDFHAQYNPNEPYAKFPSQSGTGITSISFHELSRATHKIAHILRPNREGTDGQVVGVLIHCDVILYAAVILGIVQPFPISPRNSAAAVANMLDQTSSRWVISQEPLSSLVQETRAELEKNHRSLRVDALPNLYDIFPTIRGSNSVDSDSFVPYPSASRRPREDVVIYLHSSGSTGFPTAVPHTDITILDWCKTPIAIRSREWGIVWASMALPTFHTMGMYTQVYAPLVTGYAIGLYTPQAPLSPVVPTPQNVLETAKALGCTGGVGVPAFLEVWAQSDQDVKYLSSLKIMLFGGGPLSARSGDMLVSAGVNLCSAYGATETGSLTDTYEFSNSSDADTDGRTNADWAWLSFPKEVKHRWIPEGDGTYELQLLTSETYHPCVENLSDTRGYSTKDLFEPHPTKKGLWRITGRKDDVLVLASGEKIVPIPQEGRITSKSWFLELLYPKDHASVTEFGDSIWHVPCPVTTFCTANRSSRPIVEEANAMAPKFAQIFRDMIIITDPMRPLPRAAKSTVIRKQAIALYEKDIEGLYRSVTETAAKTIEPPTSWMASDIEEWLMKLAAGINKDIPISATVDVFEQGFDSLHATFLRNHVIVTLQGSADPGVTQAASKISHNFVFDHPTIHKLAHAISALISSDSLAEKNLAKEIVALIDKYSANLPVYTQKPVSCCEIVVFLTGSTGSVGCYILATLLSDPRVSTVYTFNRTSSTPVAKRQAAAFKDRCLPTALLSQGKHVQLVGDMSIEHFGLAKDIYDKVIHTVTHVVHNAWKVDFNLSLQSFEPLIANTRRLLDACSTFSRPVRVFYTSSISAAAGYDPALGPVPEEPLSDPGVVLATGYGASKFVVEKLLANASQAGLSTTVLRIGQVCGARESGAWSTKEWVSVLVKSSIWLGALPHLEGTVSWIPMDAVASAVKDLIVARTKLPELVNLVHPRRVAWHKILEDINKYLLDTPSPFISFEEWVGRLEAVSKTATAEDLERVPAIKLLDFFKGLAMANAFRTTPNTVEAGGTPIFSTDKLEAYSSAIRNLLPLDEEYAKSWVTYWKSKHFFLVFSVPSVDDNIRIGLYNSADDISTSAVPPVEPEISHSQWYNPMHAILNKCSDFRTSRRGQFTMIILGEQNGAQPERTPKHDQAHAVFIFIGAVPCSSYLPGFYELILFYSNFPVLVGRLQA
ncbi:hypothetical protein NM688_g2570 [Phlebia brevispora]|uniref:Uncharacterized protein n=1 Tax=Phlebia brevispora TaxID=194682 RepID=A0ACC1T8C5_9APHY|nr:hypothetical protein NM688_g2570 [Phlebia brevispora]